MAHHGADMIGLGVVHASIRQTMVGYVKQWCPIAILCEGAEEGGNRYEQCQLQRLRVETYSLEKTGASCQDAVSSLGRALQARISYLGLGNDDLATWTCEHCQPL